MFIFIDDERKPSDVTWIRLPDVRPWNWVVVRNYKEFSDVLSKNPNIQHISFDHDLGEEHYNQCMFEGGPIDYSQFKEKTGYDCAKLLVEWCMDNHRPLPQYTIHTMNPVGRENIEGLFTSFKKMNHY